MKYDVVKDYTDDEFLVPDETGNGKEPLHLVVGEVFVPAKFNYPLNKRAALVNKGIIKLIVDEAPADKKPAAVVEAPVVEAPEK